MATLSANSRRNSSTSNVSNSPRPSLTTNNNVSVDAPRSTHMQPVSEENCISPVPIPLKAPPTIVEAIVEPQQPDQIDNAHYLTTKLSPRPTKENTCTERSDSGFSDCSTSSTTNTTTNNIHLSPGVASTHPLLDKANSISEEKLSNSEHNTRENGVNNVKEIGGKLSVNMLKLKLEKIAEAQQEPKSFRKSVNKLPTPQPIVTNDSPIELHRPSEDHIKRSTQSLNETIAIGGSSSEIDIKTKLFSETVCKTNLMRSSSLHHKRIVEKEPIMKSDFTNTVKMRKKSLETNALREKLIHSPRILLEPSGKVSKLLQRFDSQNSTIANDSTTENASSEPIVESPSIESATKAMPFEEHTRSASQPDHEIVEILKTPLSMATRTSPRLHVSPRSMSPTKVHSKIVKSTSVSSSSSMKRSVTTKHEVSSTKTNVSMETKINSPRVSPTKLTNTQCVPTNRSKTASNQVNNINLMKKSQKSHTAETTVAVKQAQSTAVRPAKTACAAAPHKTTAYASFNRTSPVRLSNRVKEVTDRLSTPKQIVKRPIPIRATLSPSKFIAHSASAVTTISQEHTSQTIKQSNHGISCSSTITTTQEMQQIFTAEAVVVDGEQHVERSINGKIDGDFTIKSKMNENFRKASAFWKAT